MNTQLLRTLRVAGCNRSVLHDSLLPTFLNWVGECGLGYEVDNLNGQLVIESGDSETYRRIHSTFHWGDYWYCHPRKSHQGDRIHSFYKALDAGQVKLLLSTTPDEPQSSEGTNMTEKNAAAFMRENTRTVQVKFTGAGATDKEYTYVTNLNVKEDDYVVVPARDTFTLAKVSKVDDDLMLEPKSGVKYSWIVAVVDMASYERLLEENAQIEEVIRKSYQHNARSAFRNMLLEAVPEDQRQKLKLLTGG